MDAPNTSTAGGTMESNSAASLSADELSAKAIHKRYEGLVMVRTKAIKGKGAWYWAHLDPMLIHSADSGLPKSVKLRCSLCEATFSASNPSRTASEHLKKGACPNFNAVVNPISSVSPSSIVSFVPMSSPQFHQEQPSNNRKRGGHGRGRSSVEDEVLSSNTPSSPYDITPIAVNIDQSRFALDLAYSPTASVRAKVVATATSSGGGDAATMYAPNHHQPQPQPQPQQHLILSGGREDLGALAMLHDSVKRLKSPKSSDGPALSKTQIDSALDYLSEWAYECCGTVSFSSLEHPKFKAFLNQVGLPNLSRREFAATRLNAKYEEAKADSEAKTRDALFFQIASSGWKSKVLGQQNLVHLAVNLPNGNSAFKRAIFTSGFVPSQYAEEVLWDTVIQLCGNNVQQCAGIVADKFKAKALKNLENRHHWMVNLSCQYQGFNSLIKDFHKELHLFKNVTDNCLKLVNFVNNNPQLRSSFHKYQMQEYGHASLLKAPSLGIDGYDLGQVFSMLDDILSSVRALHLILHDECYKVVSMEEPIAREIEEMTRNQYFWNDLGAVHSLVKLIKTTVHDIEIEKPRVGQCLPLWEELKVKVNDLCSKFHISEGQITQVIEKRFRKNYHPSWAAAFILDPINLIKDTSGKYLPPFKYLTPEQEKDVDKLVTRLVAREEAHIAIMELMKWRTEGLDPVYAQAVQLKQRDPNTGKMKIAHLQSSRLVWETYLTEFMIIGKVAVRLIFLHATSCGFKCNLSLLRWVQANSNSRVAMDRAQKLVFIAAHQQLERGDFSNNKDKDAELFALVNGEDDVLNDVFVDPSAFVDPSPL